MLKICQFFEKYVLHYETIVCMVVLVLTMLFLKADADLQRLKYQAIAHGFAKYDETQGNWRWISEEDMLK